MDSQSQINKLIREYNNVQNEILIALKKNIKRTNPTIWNEMIHRRSGYEKTLQTKHNYTGHLEPHVEVKNPVTRHTTQKIRAEKPQVEEQHTEPPVKYNVEKPAVKYNFGKPEPNAEIPIAYPVSETEEPTNCSALKEPDTENRKEIVLGGESFFLSFTNKAYKRRKIAFSSNNPMECLTASEKNILKKINLTNETLNTLKPYLADFFESLPNCQTTVQMMTSKKCEIPNYVMSSLLLKARYDVQKNIESQTPSTMGNIGLYQKNAQLKALKQIDKVPKQVAQIFTGSKPCDQEDCKKIAEGITRIEALLKSK